MFTRGLCQCGCGQKTNLAPHSWARVGWIKGEPLRFIYGHNVRGKHNPKWKGGRYIDKSGYILIFQPDHPKSNNKGYVREHVLMAEKALGKHLPAGALVHHANGSKDNGPLVICQDHAYHMLLHQRQESLKACGHASWRKCIYCQKYDSMDNLHIPKGKRAAFHKACKNTYQLEYSKAKRRSHV